MTEHRQQHDTETMTRNNYAVELLSASGTIRLRLKRGITNNEMDDAQEWIRRAMIHLRQDNPLSKLVDALEVTPDALIRLKLGKGDLGRIHFEEKMVID